MPEEQPQGKLDVKSWNEADIDQVSAQRIPNLYSNNVGIGFTNWDAWIQFGHIIGQGDGKLLIEPKIRITMSLPHLKAFLTALQDSVAQFEDQFGPIEIPTPKTKE